MRSLFLLLALAVLPGLTAAQSSRRPNTRQGFWIGFGGGWGSTETKCDSTCANKRSGGFSAYLRAGGTVTSKILLGAELSGSAHWEGGVGEGLFFESFVVLWYPSPTGAWYLKGGVGAANYRADDGTNELTALAPGISLGAGHELRVSRNMSVVPFLCVVVASPVFIEYNGRPIPTGERIQVSSGQLGVGLTWH